MALIATAGAAWPQPANPHYDPKNTSESLHLACTSFRLADTAPPGGPAEVPALGAQCNFENDGLASVSILLKEGIAMRYTADGPVLRWDKISPHGAERCLYWELSLRSDGVRMRAECEKAEPPGRKYTPWLNLNNGIKWNATGKKFEWK